MKPNFLTVLPPKGAELKQLNARVPTHLIDLLHRIAETDGDGNGIQGLVVEGITRVILDRGRTPGFKEQLAATYDAEQQITATRLAFLDSIAPVVPPQE